MSRSGRSGKRPSHASAARRTGLRALGGGALLSLLLGACGSTGPSSTSSTSLPTSATSAITRNWQAFFSGATPASRKIALLENGGQFARIIDSQSNSGLARSAGAMVTHVRQTGADTATVTYTVTLGGQPALTNESGVAVLQGGAWKVESASFCALLALEQVTTAACPKATTSG